MLFEIVEVLAERGDRRGGTVTTKRGLSLVQDAVHGHAGEVGGDGLAGAIAVGSVPRCW
jgi:hypothetical protein